MTQKVLIRRKTNQPTNLHGNIGAYYRRIVCLFLLIQQRRIKENWISQQDNELKETAKSTREYSLYGIILRLFRSRSLDLNFIDHLVQSLENNINQRINIANIVEDWLNLWKCISEQKLQIHLATSY